MTKLDVSIKHSGKVHKVFLDTDAPPIVFKQSIQDLTGVPVERMKVMIKGGVLKDDSEWSKISPKQNQQFLVIGSPTILPPAPTKPVVFLEDMDESQLAEISTVPAGLRNMGNTCYMNASVQVLRAIPGLRESMGRLPDSPTSQQQSLLASLRDLYTTMDVSGSSPDASSLGVTPSAFLNTLRQLVPQFNELVQGNKGFGMRGYAQQDADECWSAVVNAMRQLPGAETGGSSLENTKNFVEQSMLAELTTELKCAEAPEEAPTITKEQVIKVDCNITVTTNFLLQGIMQSLDETITKSSPSLSRNAEYTKHSRFSRLPGNLTVHMVRFYWRADISKKAKIMRKVKFPFELDALDLCTPELKQKLLPANIKMKEIDRERRERRKVRRKTKKAVEASATSSATAAPTASASGDDVQMSDATPAPVGVGELEEESVYLEKEKKEIDAVVDSGLKNDMGASISGLYDLYGIVTHKGASADSGHYIGYVRSPLGEDDKEDDEVWHKFDDEKVSPVSRDQITALEGGGEDSVAYILLYRARELS